MQKMKHLSSIANDVVQRCALKLDTTVDKLVEEFEAEWRPQETEYSRKLVEFCGSKALTDYCLNIEEKIIDGSFTRFTFDLMLAWEMPSSAEEESCMESVGKEKEERKPIKVPQEQDDISLFYSDLMPLLVDNEPNVGEDALVWLGSLVPLVADVINGRFTFETLTAPTGYRLHFPAYDKFLKEIQKCIKHLQKQSKPSGVVLADDEFILHVEGTLTSQRVVRHIGSTSWPGRLTLTNYALYFEPSAVITYQDALKIDLSTDIDHTVKPAATGPWGAPLFDKAIVYESPELSEPVVLEFPEVTSSTRRDHWLALIKEIMLVHRFLTRFKVECPIQAWEMHARTILGIIRLHAAREMLRILPPAPTKFLIFALLDELPKGDYVLKELAESLKKVNSGHPCSASSILRSLNKSLSIIPSVDVKAVAEESTVSGDADILSPLDDAIKQSTEEAKEIQIAEATAEGLKEEGISESAAILVELLSPLKSVLPWFEEVLMWKTPATTLTLIATTLLVVYKEWIGKALAAGLLWLVAKMLCARQGKNKNKYNDEMVVRSGTDQSTMESIVSAQRGLQTVHEMMQRTNIAILKIQSILVSRTRKHANMVMAGMSVMGMLLAVVGTKYIIMGVILYTFIMTSKVRDYLDKDRGNRRMKEWWDSIPVTPVRVVDDPSHTPK